MELGTNLSLTCCKLTRVLYSTYNVSLRIDDVTYDMLDLQQQLHKHRSSKNCFINVIIIRFISKSMMITYDDDF